MPDKRKRQKRSASSGRARRGETQPRKLMLKFRVRPLARMPKSVMFDKLRDFALSGIAPDDLEVSWFSYSHLRGGVYPPGQKIEADEKEQLERFLNVMLSIPYEDMTVDAKRGERTRNPEASNAVRVERPE
jgi:hypothetical protein